MKSRGIFLLLATSLSLSACSNDVKEYHFFAFNTPIVLKCYQNIDENFVNQVNDTFWNYHQLSDAFLKAENETNIYDINLTNEKVTVKKELYDLLKFTYDNQAKFHGYYNLLIGDLTKVWKESLDSKTLPSSETINNLVNEMNNSNLLFFDKNQVQRVGNAKIDVGAVTKGYVVNQLKNQFNDNKINYYLLNAGNSSMTMTSKNGQPFKIGVQDMPNKVLQLTDCSLGTSSISEQHALINDQIYSHIVNPIDGSAISKYDAVIVKGDNAGLLDMASTAFMMMNIDDIKEISNQLNFDVLVIKDSNEVYKSEGLKYA